MYQMFYYTMIADSVSLSRSSFLPTKSTAQPSRAISLHVVVSMTCVCKNTYNMCLMLCEDMHVQVGMLIVLSDQWYMHAAVYHASHLRYHVCAHGRETETYTAIARPIPLEAPVTMPIRPSNAPATIGTKPDGDVNPLSPS